MHLQKTLPGATWLAAFFLGKKKGAKYKVLVILTVEKYQAGKNFTLVTRQGYSLCCGFNGRVMFLSTFYL